MRGFNWRKQRSQEFMDNFIIKLSASLPKTAPLVREEMMRSFSKPWEMHGSWSAGTAPGHGGPTLISVLHFIRAGESSREYNGDGWRSGNCRTSHRPSCEVPGPIPL